MHLGRQIRMARTFRGMSQEDLAEAISKTRSLISAIERKGRVNSATFNDILKALEMTQEEFFEKFAEERPGYQSKLEEENESLRKEIEQLQKLVSVQQDLIDLLKKDR